MTFDRLKDSTQLEVLNTIKKIGKRYVIGAFYTDTNSFFYEFDLKREYLKFNKERFKDKGTAASRYHRKTRKK
jgi:hypothetical protein